MVQRLLNLKTPLVYAPSTPRWVANSLHLLGSMVSLVAMLLGTSISYVQMDNLVAAVSNSGGRYNNMAWLSSSLWKAGKKRIIDVSLARYCRAIPPIYYINVPSPYQGRPLTIDSI